jgi:hypothetical protein
MKIKTYLINKKIRRFKKKIKFNEEIQLDKIIINLKNKIHHEKKRNERTEYLG